MHLILGLGYLKIFLTENKVRLLCKTFCKKCGYCLRFWNQIW